MNYPNNSQSGFNLLQALIFSFICLVVILVVFAAYASAQRTAKNAQRVSDVQQLRVALKYYYDEFGQYPQSSSSYQAVGMNNEFARFVSQWPVPPAIGGPCAAQPNIYAYEQVNGGETYQLKFCLGESFRGLPAGIRIATPGGFQ